MCFCLIKESSHFISVFLFVKVDEKWNQKQNKKCSIWWAVQSRDVIWEIFYECETLTDKNSMGAKEIAR